MDAKQSRSEEHAAERARPVEDPRPRRRPAEGVARASAGAESEDVRSLVMHLARRVDELTGALDEARRRVVELETRADEDPLLPVLNRRGFVRELGRAIAFLDRYGTGASLAVIDVDGLRSINEAHGHAAGDAVLAAVARCIRANVRASDVIGRLGGDEFGVILWTASAADARNKAAWLAGRIAEEPVIHAGLPVRIAASPVATAIVAADTVEAVLARAEAAMLRAKAGA